MASRRRKGSRRRTASSTTASSRRSPFPAAIAVERQRAGEMGEPALHGAQAFAERLVGGAEGDAVERAAVLGDGAEADVVGADDADALDAMPGQDEDRLGIARAIGAG